MNTVLFSFGLTYSFSFVREVYLAYEKQDRSYLVPGIFFSVDCLPSFISPIYRLREIKSVLPGFLVDAVDALT